MNRIEIVYFKLFIPLNMWKFICILFASSRVFRVLNCNFVFCYNKVAQRISLSCICNSGVIFYCMSCDIINLILFPRFKLSIAGLTSVFREKFENQIINFKSMEFHNITRTPLVKENRNTVFRITLFLVDLTNI